MDLGCLHEANLEPRILVFLKDNVLMRIEIMRRIGICCEHENDVWKSFDNRRKW
jgi:hypothetical protein